jgi:retron-type reverse transcriptase
MAAESSAGATPSVPRDWHSIDWKKAHANVRRLQARIVQAMKAGKWGKVKALQHLLTRSFSAKALAVALVGFQGRGLADGVQPDFCHPLFLEALIFQ